jgi:hypothetical protein
MSKEMKRKKERAYSWQKSGPTAGVPTPTPGRPVGLVSFPCPSTSATVWMPSTRTLWAAFVVAMAATVTSWMKPAQTLDTRSTTSLAAGLLPQGGQASLMHPRSFTTNPGSP